VESVSSGSDERHQDAATELLRVQSIYLDDRIPYLEIITGKRGSKTLPTIKPKNTT
jgi:hypothetical protein